MMNKIRRIAVAGLAALALVLSGCNGAEETPTPDLAADFVPVVSVTGEVMPVAWAGLSAQAGGTVVEVLVEPGTEVAVGAVLIRLDATDAELVVQQAEAALEAAEAQHALLDVGARAEEIASAEAQVKAAEAAVSQAVAQRDQVQAGTAEAEIAAAEAQVAAAVVDQRAAREVHDKTMKCYTVGGDKVCPGLGKYEEEARFMLHAADEALRAARAQLDALTGGADDQLRAADAAVWAAAAQRDVAQAQLDLLQAGATPEEVAVAVAAVSQAEASLETARVALKRTQITAPFAGTVGAVDVRVGELVSPGDSLVTLGDLATLRVETTDLDEIDVAKVVVGQKANLAFDAAPERVFTGTVTRISPMADPGQGGVHYGAVIEMDELDDAIRWGMTAFVDIEVEE